MSRWFRHYAGMMRDEKLVRIAVRTKQPIERVLWIWGAILESAAEVNDDGRFDFDTAEAAYFLRADEDELLAIVDALEGAGRLADGAVVKWGERQFKSDSSAERQSRYRQRKAQDRDRDGAETHECGDSDVRVTSPSRHGDAPETETETEEESNPPNPPAGGRRGKALLPEDWDLPPVDDLPPKAKACAEQWTAESYETHGEAFTSYWRSRRGMQADWRLTWANRVVALHGQVMRDQKFGNAPTASAKLADLARWTPERRAEYARQLEERAA